ncbi:Isochorismatase hydrolase [Cristinia sonorae]|uniref:Isochorismatase hydrolase n=1 Tax=Cristinia sonorae TaxID=1940300 RepID=A0A8K0XPT8_9AGAR|nr:Isochorismatase hydrolase [Cristinia sonorae]
MSPPAAPIHDTPILGMVARPNVDVVTEYGNAASFWVEYPSGLVDLTRSAHIVGKADTHVVAATQEDVKPPPLKQESQFELEVEGGRTLRLNKTQTAIVIIDMQNFFLHPDLRDHPTGLKCVPPLQKAVPALRSLGSKIIWVNWGLTDHELTTIPPSLVRGFMKSGKGGFGSKLAGEFGRLLMRGEYNSDLYGPLQPLYEEGKAKGTDVWIHKNRMSGLWGPQSALDLYLQEEGITTLLFAGVNADQCVLGTLIDSYYRGYDCVTVRDAVATSSPTGGYENMIYNSGNSYGFLTDSEKIVKAAAA